MDFKTERKREQEGNGGHGMDEEGSERFGIENKRTGPKYSLHPTTEYR